MVEANVYRMIEEIKISLERMELLLRERYIQMIQSFFARTTEQLRREIQVGFSSLSFAQSTNELTALVDSLSKFNLDIEKFISSFRQEVKKDVKAYSVDLQKSVESAVDHISNKGTVTQEITQLQQGFAKRLDSIENQISEISRAIGSLLSPETISPTDAVQTKQESSLIITSKQERGLKNVIADFLSYSRWKFVEPHENRSQSDLLEKLNDTKGTALSIAGDNSLPATLRKNSLEFAKLATEAEEIITNSDKYEFSEDDLQELIKIQIRLMRRLAAEID